MTNKQLHSTPFQITSTHATAAVCTKTGVTNQTFCVTDVSGSSDSGSATISIKDGSTTIWQDRIGTQIYNHSFVSPIQCTKESTLTVTVTGSAVCYSNVAGFVVNNS